MEFTCLGNVTCQQGEKSAKGQQWFGGILKLWNLSNLWLADVGCNFMGHEKQAGSKLI